MLEIAVPGYRHFRFQHLVLDFNGTLAVDGVLLGGVSERLSVLAQKLTIHVLTADTFGRAREQLRAIACGLTVLDARNQSQAKRDYVERLQPEQTVCIGNGRNDRLMLASATLGIAIVGEEGAAAETATAAAVITRDVLAALDLLLQPLRLIATLRD